MLDVDSYNCIVEARYKLEEHNATKALEWFFRAVKSIIEHENLCEISPDGFFKTCKNVLDGDKESLPDLLEDLKTFDNEANE